MLKSSTFRAIVTFHSVDDAKHVLSYSPALFEYLLKYLHAKKIPVVGLDQLLSNHHLPGVALTFDDGMKSVYENALPILKKFNAGATVYISTDLIGSENLWPASGQVGQYEMMGWDEVINLHEAGIEIGAHTCSHPDMRTLNGERVEQECSDANKILLQQTGCKPSHFAYPFGYHNDAVRKQVASFYDTAVTTELAFLQSDHDRCAIPRIDSYYLRSQLMIDQLDSILMRLYMKTRSRLRTLSGSQCPAA